MAPLHVHVGQRIQLAEYRGTVKYIGQMENRKGEWIGIDWDDPARGKHDGSVDSVRYFETKDGEKSGSFVPAERFRSGMDLVTALVSRYSNVGENAYQEEDMFVSTANQKTKKIELVGLSKIEKWQKNTSKLKSVDLSGLCIDRAGSLEELSKLLSNLEEMNLSYNLIREWNTVSNIVFNLPKLRTLTLSGNLFLKPEECVKLPEADEKLLSSSLEVLILNECQLNWKQATSIMAWIPNLKEIQVLGNEITSLVSENEAAFQNLEVVDLSLNKIGDWNEIRRLSKLPFLKRINLTGNPLKSVEYEQDQSDYFKSLESLLLGDCAIDCWETVDALNLFPRLRETRLTGTPLMQGPLMGRRFEIVARVAGLVQLNGSKISPHERTDCERRYISHVAIVAIQQDLDPETIQKRHPRYSELIAKHGTPTTNAATAKQTGALRENVIDILLTCHAPSAGKKMGTQKKKVSLNMSLGTLRTLAESLFSIPKEKMKLYLKSDKGSFPENITDVKDDRRLGDLCIIDNQEIVINE